jgi:hypothetical protein
LNDFRASALLMKGSAQLFPPQLKQKLLGFGAHTDYLCRAMALGDALTKQLVMSILKQRSLLPDAAAQTAQAAKAALLGLLKEPTGTDEERMELMRWLLDNKLASPSEPMVVWLRGKLESVQSSKIALTEEPLEALYAVQEDPRYSEFLDLCHQKRFQQAHDVALQLCHEFPADPPAWTNLVTVKAALRHPQAELNQLSAHAFALDPSYFFACTGYAICLARQGKTDEANALLKPLTLRTEFHVSQYRSLLNAQVIVAQAMGLTDNAKSIQRVLDDLNE